MSASNKLEDSLQACREIQIQIGSNVTIPDREEDTLIETQNEMPIREEEDSKKKNPFPTITNCRTASGA